jgi:exonuclease VII small subunit
MQWVLVLALAFDLAGVKSEPNLEKRSELALNNANTALDAARDAYNQGNYDQTKTELEEVQQSVDLAYQSLADTGKDPRRTPKFFKRAELRTRELLRRLEGLGETVSFTDRSMVEKVRDRVSEIHDDLINGVLTKRKK